MSQDVSTATPQGSREKKRTDRPLVVHTGPRVTAATTDVEQEVEPVAVAGLAFPETETEVETDPEAEVLPTTGQVRHQRQLGARRLRQAAKLGLDPTDPRFEAALSSGPAYLFAAALTRDQWKLATVADIRATTPISAAQWDERRRARVDLLTDDDEQWAAAGWGLSPDHTNVQRALKGDQAHWTFARTLTGEQLEFISGKKWRDCAIPSAGDILSMKKIRAEEEAKARIEKEKKDKEEAAQAKRAQDAQVRAQGEASWNQHRDTVSAGIRARLELEAPGLAVETIEKLIAGTGERIAGNKQINIANQIKTLDKDIAAEIIKSRKRTDINAIKARYTSLKGNLLKDLIEASVNNPAHVVADFEQAADRARVDQRNLVGVRSPAGEWCRLLGLKLYKEGADTPFERLTPQAGLETHYSVGLTSINLATAFTLTTTAADLVDTVLSLAGADDRPLRLHVSLETEVKDDLGRLALPHRYWPVAGARQPTDYDFTFAGGRRRWKPTHTKDQVRAALDEAYDELRARLVARAQVLLDRDCNA